MDRETDTSGKNLPAGTVTFLFTDIEGSTKLLHQLGEQYVTLLADHHRLMREVFSRWKGREFGTGGDAFFVSFARATEAVAAVVNAQRTLAGHAWPEGVTVRVRMGLHTGEPWTGGEDYLGVDVHRAARIAHVGYGGQVLVSETTTYLVIDQLPAGVSLLDLGRHRLKDMKRPERVHQLVIEGLPSAFPPLKSLGIVVPTGPDRRKPARPPAFLEELESTPVHPVFVSREQELAWLEQRLEVVHKGQGQVVFVTGEAGMGKSSLLHAFARKAAEANPDLLVTWGQCNAFSGQGDPYLPFREIFAQLCGDVEGPWRSGLLAEESARRLWLALPETAGIISTDGAELMENFISGKALLGHLMAAAPQEAALHSQIQGIVNKEALSASSTSQSRLFEQVAGVLDGLSADHPLLIILDDLQWVDRGSIDLLFHLGRQLIGKRILVVGAYRPEDVAAGRDGARHPLLPIVDEFKRLFGDITLDLGHAEGQAFVEAFVDSDPNNLERAFRDRLYRRTGGHPLFTVELLRDMQERGDLVKEDDGYWVEGADLDWDRLPTKMEGVIESRIGRLEEELREILTVAAVEGEDFTAQVVAKVQQIQERKLFRTLSRELEKHHQLVKERETIRLGAKSLYRFRFAHALFQRYLYNEISEGERQLLHGEVGAILEELYADNLDDVSLQLGSHFAAAGDVVRAKKYLIAAGDRACQLFAFSEAASAYEKSLALFRETDDQESIASALMTLGQIYHNNYQFSKSQRAYEEAFTLARQRLDLPYRGDPTVIDPTVAMHGYFIEPPITFDAAMTDDSISPVWIRRLFEGLVEWSTEGKIVPNIAYRWEVLNDGRQYVFHLRDDVLWSDGQPLTAPDFEYAWKRVLAQSHLANAICFYDVQGAEDYHKGRTESPDQVGIRAVDDHTLVIDLIEPVGYFLQIPLIEASFPIPRHRVETFGDKWAEPRDLVVNGPFLVESWEPDEKIVLVRNPRYFGRSAGNVYRFEAKRTTMEALGAAYESNEIDLLSVRSLAQKERQRLINSHPKELVTYPNYGVSCLSFNVKRPPLDDVRIRRALGLAINKQKLMPGDVHWKYPATGGFVPPGMPGHVTGIGTHYHPASAQELLAKAGFPNGKGFPVLTLIASEWIPSQLLEELVAFWSHHLGIIVSHRRVPLSEKGSLIKDSDIHVMNLFPSYPDPDDCLRTIYGVYSDWESIRYLDLVNRARVTQDQSQRLDMYRRAELILCEEMPIIPLFYGQTTVLRKPWLNYKIPRPGVPYLKNMTIDPDRND
jgi:ABC-type oligopeptide transport system substrate-binding subunit/class 3 adenylate cyclase